VDLECDKIQSRRISPFSTPFRLELPVRRSTMSASLGVPQRQLSDLSMSPFTPVTTLEYSLKSCGERLIAHDVTGTPNSLFAKFKAEKHHHYTPLTPQTPTPTTPWVIAHQDPMGSPSLGELGFPHEKGQEEGQKNSNELEIESEKDNMEDGRLSLENRVDTQQIPERSIKRRKLNPQYFRSAEFRVADILLTPENEEFSQPNLCIDHPSHPTGERLYVQGLMRKLLQNPDIIEFPHNEATQRTVWTLYSSKYLKKHEQHTALVFDSTSDGCNVFRASVGTLGIPEQFIRRERKSKDRTERFRLDGDSQEGGDEWAYLEKWTHMEDDKILPLFNESDSDEGRYDESTIREMEIEERQKNGEQEAIAQPLSVIQVREVIANELARFEELWREKKLPRWTAKAYRVYKRYHRRKTKKSKTARCRGELELVKERIEEFKHEYEEIEWKSVGELIRMCANLQESVKSQMELQWHIDLLTGPRPGKLAKTREPVDDDIPEAEAEAGDVPVDEEAAESGEGDEDEENEEMEDEMMDEMEDEMEGFIIDDDDIDVNLPEGDFGFGDLAELDDDEDDGDVEDNDVEDAGAGLTPNRLKRKASKIEELNDTIDDDVEESTEQDVDLENDNEVENDNEAKNLERPELPTPLTQKVDTSDSSSHAKRIPKYALRSGSNATDSLPTPPQEPDEDMNSDVNVQVKKERDPTVSTASNLHDSVDYDSDIFCSFGDKEISEFCQCTECPAAIAKDYLLKADGNTSRAISFYFEDLANDRVPESSKKRKKTRTSRKGKEVVRISDSDDDEICGRNTADMTTFLRPALSHILPRDETLQAVKDLVSSLPSQVLHENMNNIVGLLVNGRMDPTKQFLIGETMENCAAYWKIYLAYTEDLFGKPRTKKLVQWCIERIQHPQRFAKFYDRLCLYLNTQLHEPRKSTQNSVPESSQISESQFSPARHKDKKQRRKKDKPAKNKILKPVIKSTEQKLQEAELKRIADRERDQQKKGKFTTTTADGGVIINARKKHSEYTVSLHPELAKVMKAHQIEGVQFMWLQV